MSWKLSPRHAYLAALLLLLASPALAEPYVVCDPNSGPVPHRVKRVLRSVHGPDMATRKDVVALPVRNGTEDWRGRADWSGMVCDGGDGITTAYTRVRRANAAERRLLTADAEARERARAEAAETASMRSKILAGAILDRPTCNEENRGVLYIAFNRSRRDDICAVCIRNKLNKYQWATLSTD